MNRPDFKQIPIVQDYVALDPETIEGAASPITDHVSEVSVGESGMEVRAKMVKDISSEQPLPADSDSI